MVTANKPEVKYNKNKNKNKNKNNKSEVIIKIRVIKIRVIKIRVNPMSNIRILMLIKIKVL